MDLKLKTSEGRNIYSWGLGNLFIYSDNLDFKAISNGGCFLFTHQRDNGLIIWYKKSELKIIDNAWETNGVRGIDWEFVYSFLI